MKRAVVVLFVFLARSAVAGGPFVIDTVGNTGVAEQWMSNTVTWYSDDGPLSTTVPNQAAVSWVQDAFAKWRDLTIKDANGDYLKTVDLTVNYAGGVGKDINATNYSEYLSPGVSRTLTKASSSQASLASAGQTVVIFDADGSIFDALGVDKNSILGLTAPVLSDASGTKILQGFSLFNGTMLASGKLSKDPMLAQELFQATMFHEIGHLLNLDHTQINLDIAQACSLSATCQDGQFIPTMFPELKTFLQGTPSRDDKITLSWIYPSKDFQSNFCTITGSVQDASGMPLRGVNVIAKRVNDGDTLTREDARSMVSGALYQGCSNNADYVLYGIVPGKQYQVVYEPLATQYTGQSGFGPLDHPPSNFDTGTVSTADGSGIVSCDTAGKVIKMPTVQVAAKNPCSNFAAVSGGAAANATPSTTGQPATSGGSCSLVLRR